MSANMKLPKCRLYYTGESNDFEVFHENVCLLFSVTITAIVTVYLAIFDVFNSYLLRAVRCVQFGFRKIKPKMPLINCFYL